MLPAPPSPLSFKGYNIVKLFFKNKVPLISPVLLGLKIMGPIENFLWGGT